VVIAPARARRPGAAAAAAVTDDDPAGCPFCEGREAATPPEAYAIASPGRVPDSPGWRVRVVPNKFPAFGPWPDEPGRSGLLARRPAIGRQEVVVHSPRHVLSLADLTSRELQSVAEAWQARAEAAREAGFPYVHALVNEGRAAGASLAHSHSQLVWLPGEPPAAAEERTQAGGGCALCRLLAEESGQRIRVVAERDGFLLVCAWAGRTPYEMLVAPRECTPDAFADGLADGLALAAEGIRRLHIAEGRVSLNLWLRPGGHWRIEVLPRLTAFAGLELGAGYFVNTTAPESAAGILREA
jgi:UDPglucose--hexose-1-phosphate uridylyltransferase